MSIYRKIQVLLGGLWMFVLPLSGQTEQENIGDIQWTLENCIEYALENNLTLKQNKLEIISGEASLMQAKSSRLPSLSASASVSGNNSMAYDNTGGKFSTGANMGINANVPVYQGGTINNNIKASNIELQKKHLDVKEAENNIVLSITQGWMNVLFARENYIYYTEIEATSKAALERTKALFKAGTVSRQDLAEIEAQYASDRYTMVTSKNKLDVNVTDLKTILDLPYDLDFKPDWPESIAEPTADLPPFSVIADEVVSQRPEIENSQLSQNVAELDLANAKAGYLPSLNLSGSASSSYSDIYDDSFSTQINDRFTQNIGLSLSIPVFSRNENKANVARSRINLQQAELQSKDTRNQLLQTVEQVYVDVLAQKSRYDAAVEQAAASKLSYELRQEQFNLGMLNAIDLRQAKNTLLNASSELIQAKYSALLYQKILDFYRGIPITLADTSMSK